MTGTALRRPTAHTIREEGLWEGPVIDADVHVMVPSLAALHPYLDEVWIQLARERGWPGPNATQGYPTGSPAYARPEWRPPDGRPAASSLELLSEQLLGPLAPEAVILNCTFPVDSGHPDPFGGARARGQRLAPCRMARP
jgi:uncharacterized protein